MSSILVGVALSFAASDGSALTLSVSLAESATVSLEWGELRMVERGAPVLRFGPLPAPRDAPLEYRLSVASEPARTASLAPIAAPLRVAVYGDSRSGSGPHAAIAAAIRAEKVQAVLHSGDVVRHAGDALGWREHFEALGPLAFESPWAVAVGNHEVHPSDEASAADGLAALRARYGSPGDPQFFSVELGPALFLFLDSNSLGPDSPQWRFIDATLGATRAPHSFVVLHHGPLSSGPHGPHPLGEPLLRRMEAHGVRAVFSGHDHAYERLFAGGTTYVVSGGGGAPPYPKRRALEESALYVPDYHWVLLTVTAARAWMEVRSLEGNVIDRAELAPRPTGRSRVAAPSPLGFGAIAVAAAAFLAALVGLVRGR